MMERRKLLVASCAVVLVLVLIAIGIFAMNSRANATGTTSSATGTVQHTSKTVSPYTKPLKEYGTSIKNQMAQGLKLTTDQIATQLKAGKSLSDIATAQGLSASQLQNLIATSLQNGFQPAIISGELTQKQVTVLIKRWQKNPNQLEHLLEARPKKATSTSVVGATPTP